MYKDDLLTRKYKMSAVQELTPDMKGPEERPYLHVHDNLDNYLSDWFWAFTVPTEAKIIRWSPGRQDYRLHILEHEIEHNVNPGASEYRTDISAQNSGRQYLRERFALKRN